MTNVVRTLAAAALLAAVACGDTPAAPRATSAVRAMPVGSLGDVSARMVAARGETVYATASGVTGRDLQLVFEHPGSGDHAFWRVGAGGVTSTGSYGVVPTTWSIVGAGDVSGDGIDDIYWQNAPTNSLVAWRLDANDALSASVPLASYAPAPWKVVAVADFDRNGSADLLWRNATSGDLVLWRMNGAALSSSAAVGSVPTAWQVAAIGDLDGDGTPDVFWQNTTTGARVAWRMAAGGIAIASTIDLGVVPTSWSIAAVGDYDDDGHADIFWQQPATGVLVVWRMNGATYLGTIAPGSPPAPWLLKAVRRAGGNGPGTVQVTVQSLVATGPSGTPVPADLSAVRGPLVATVTVNPAGTQVDSVRMEIGGTHTKCAALNVVGAAVQTTCTLQTSEFDATTGVPLALNGPGVLQFRAYYHPLGSFVGQVVTASQQAVTLANVSGVYAKVTNTPSAAQASVNAAGQTTGPQGVLWRAGSVRVTLLPVSYGTPAPTAPFVVTLQDANGAVAQRPAAQDAGAPTYSATFPGATAGAYDGTPGPAAATLDGYTSPNAGAPPTSPTGQLQAGTFVVVTSPAGPAGTTVLDAVGRVASLVANGVTTANVLGAPIYVDDQAPQPAAQFGTAGIPASNFAFTGSAYVGFVNATFAFATQLTPMFAVVPSNAGLGLTPVNGDFGGVDRTSTLFYAGSSTNAGVLTSGTPVTTGVQLAPNGSNTGYNLAVALFDALGNVRVQRVGGAVTLGASGTAATVTLPVSFGTDFLAPTVLQTAGFTTNTATSGAGPSVYQYAGTDETGFGINPILVTLSRTARITSATSPVGGQADVSSSDPATAGPTGTYCAVSVDFSGVPTFANTPGGVCQAIPTIGTVVIPAGLNGQYQIVAQARDQSGNLSAPLARTLVVDTKSPVFGGLAIPQVMMGGAPVPFFAAASDNLELGSASGAIGYGATPYALQYPDLVLGTPFDGAFVASSNPFQITVPSFIRSLAVYLAPALQSSPVVASVFTGFVSDVAGGVTSLSVPLPSANIPGTPATFVSLDPATNLETFALAPVGAAAPTISGGAAPATPTFVDLKVTWTGAKGVYLSPFQRVEIWVRTGTAPNGQSLHRLVGVLPGAVVTDGASDRSYTSTLRVAVGSPYVTAPSGGSRAYDFLAVGVSAAGDAIVSGYVTVTVVP
ncbi:hypothetical protein J421_0089 [Gemmatirosa kalamazoonensis]|uniref:FG-GAP repeat protein n=1 Tax=Gemmatirosa kalamazoonensis TaxID=861299 RepID=W0R9Z3_9BACT|nr:VCBS repeat-containing protein [Gemmatirosa kalamazoonensis]AHG87626.1 hypothetical protein J421_0089 [Gemmatirosa kalamazoonensis]